VNTPAGGGTNWFAPSYNPETELFYVQATRGYSIAYVYDTAPKPQGYAGGAFGLWTQPVLQAIDVRTGDIRWTHEYSEAGGPGVGEPGILTTPGGLLITGGPASVVAHDPATGKILWHQRLLRGVTNGPSTWMLGGIQHLLVGAGDTLYAFKLPQAANGTSRTTGGT
jgi:outer membrane protein assembly factor BamB